MVNLEAIVVGLAGPIIAVYLAKRKDKRDKEAAEQSAALQVALLDERLKHVPIEIRAAIVESRGQLVEQLQNGLGQAIIRPVIERLEALEKRLDRRDLSKL